MKAIFSPGPSFFNPQVRQYAGWVGIYDLMHQALQELGYEVIIPQVDPDLVEEHGGTVAKMTTWDLLAADQLPQDVDLWLGPPGYSLAQIMRLQASAHEFRKRQWHEPKIATVVWNNADWWRDQQLAEEMKAMGRFYDLSPAWRWINKRAVELSDTVIACSPFVANTWSKVTGDGGKKVRTAFWGVDSQRFTPDWAWQDKNMTGDLKVLFVGSDPIRKGLRFLLDAVDRTPGVHLTVAGCPNIGGELGPHITNVGMIPFADMPALVRHHHVSCMPTLEDGIAVSVQEAMASGLVPIATPDAAEVFGTWAQDQRGITPHIVAGAQVPFAQSEPIIAALVFLRDHLGARAEIARNARRIAEASTWAAFKEDFKAAVQR